MGKGASKFTKKKIIISVILAVVIIIMAVGGFLFYKGYIFMKAVNVQPKTNVLKQPKTDERINILVVGLDSGEFADWNRYNDIGRTDTIMLVSFDPKTNNISIISIPRDTRVQTKDGQFHKINEVFPLYGGIDATIQEVSDLTGVPVHHYLQANYASFIDVVDVLNGVTVDVDKDINNSVNIPTNIFTPGVQKLTGKKAFYFVQARNSDLDRIKRQQVFLKALYTELKKPENFVKVPTILDKVKNDIKTDMSATDILSLANSINKVGVENIQTDVAPGVPQYIDGISYYIADNDIKEFVSNKLK